jgi:alpha-glucosidase
VRLALLLPQRGTPFLYYGEELGMRDISLKRDEILDPPGKLYWPFYKGRDGCRSPMQWNAEVNAGFSTVKPWLPVHPNYIQRNVDARRADPRSLLNLTRALLRLRKEYISLRRGAFIPVEDESKDHLSYLRRSEGETLLVALNFKNRPKRVDLPQNLQGGTWQVLLSTHRAEPDMQNGLVLRPYEVCVMRRL